MQRATSKFPTDSNFPVIVKHTDPVMLGFNWKVEGEQKELFFVCGLTDPIMLYQVFERQKWKEMLEQSNRAKLKH